jgi:type II secretory pathway pseudopilin PulG
MESHRQGRRLITASRSRQRGITLLGLLILAMLVGIVGLAAIKIVPMYIMDLKLSKALEGISEDLNGKEVSPQSIQYALAKRFSVEDVNLPKDSIKVAPSKNGFAVRIQYENRASYLGDVWLMVVFDKTVEIRK